MAQETVLDPFVISATRKSESLSSLSSSVTVITKEEIDKQVSLSNNDLASALGKLVPGLAVGNQTMSSYGQTIRGRKPIILVDGVQQNPIFDPGKNFWVIDPSLIERIEVVRGTTAIYGDGATGGLINIITKKPTDGAPINTTTVGTNFSLSSFDEDSFGKNISHTTTGKSGAFGYVFGAAYVTAAPSSMRKVTASRRTPIATVASPIPSSGTSSPRCRSTSTDCKPHS